VDYILVTNLPVTFNPGENSKTVFITLCGDSIVEPTETINLTLTGANVGTPNTATMFVNDTANAFRQGGGICTTLADLSLPRIATDSGKSNVETGQVLRKEGEPESSRKNSAAEREPNRFPVSIIRDIFHWRVCACDVLEVTSRYSGCCILHVFAGALCCGGTSE
jgi:hypothetical protein